MNLDKLATWIARAAENGAVPVLTERMKATKAATPRV